jgi:hypothetical protein
VWALGITAIEMAECTPPRWAVHPLRVIFMINREAPPTLAERERWSPAFHDFVAQCLQKVGRNGGGSAGRRGQKEAAQPYEGCNQKGAAVK